jgi:hypothetical protein
MDVVNNKRDFVFQGTNLSQKSTSFRLPMGVDFSCFTKAVKHAVHG